MLDPLERTIEALDRGDFEGPELNRRFMHDFSLIQDFEPWEYEQNAAFEEVLATHVDANDVIVTHHLPAFDSVPARFARSAMNAFFVCAAGRGESSLRRRRGRLAERRRAELAPKSWLTR